MMKIGELYRRDGVWNGQQIVFASVDPPVHLTVVIQNQNRRPIRRRVRPALLRGSLQKAAAGLFNWLGSAI